MNQTPHRTTDVLHNSRKQKSHPNLPEYVRQVRHQKNLSLADVSARSGGQIGTTHVNRIENRVVTNVSLLRLRALARGLGVPEDEILAVARGKFPRSTHLARESELINYFRELPDEAQQYVLHMVRGVAAGTNPIPEMKYKRAQRHNTSGD